MRLIFVDTLYIVALVNPQDQWHAHARRAKDEVGAGAHFVTTEAVLTELLNFFSAFRSEMRRAVAGIARDILDDAEVETLPITRDLFMSGLALYEARPDKGYSLTDCLSMHVMHKRGIVEVLTHDKHFVQEGFTVLL